MFVDSYLFDEDTIFHRISKINWDVITLDQTVLSRNSPGDKDSQNVWRGLPPGSSHPNSILNANTSLSSWPVSGAHYPARFQTLPCFRCISEAVNHALQLYHIKWYFFWLLLFLNFFTFVDAIIKFTLVISLKNTHTHPSSDQNGKSIIQFYT